MTTAVVVQSGHNLASPRQLTAVLDAHAIAIDASVWDGASKLIELTEMAAGKFHKPLLVWAKTNGWHLFHPTARGPSECAVLTSRPIHRQTYLLLTDKTLDPKVTGRTAGLFVDAVQPEGDNWHAVWHSPAHNQGLASGNHAARVYLDALTGLKVWRMNRGKVAIGGDWNADPTSNRHVAEVLDAHFPHLRWAGNVHQKPTQGGRVIDGVLTNRRVFKLARTLPPMPGFDHRGVLVVLG